MLKKETYEKVSEVFGTVVGMATMIGMIDLKEVKDAEEPVTYKKYSDEIDVNEIINLAIECGKYRELQKRLVSIKPHHRLKEKNLYKRAWDSINKK